MTVPSFLLLVLAGVGAGLAGSIGGLASLFSYPALLAAGLSASAANVTNTVALAVSSVSSISSSRPELAGQAARARMLGVVCAAGGALGAVLVLLTPTTVFAKIVPVLVAGAALVLLARPLLGTPRPDTPGVPRPPGPLLLAGTLAIAVYGGYFGAAAGVLMLALFLAALPETLIRVSALKNVLLGLTNLVAAAGFSVFGPVSWTTALPLTIGLVAGNWVGPGVARRLPPTPMRIGIALAGLGLAVKLGLDAYR